MKKLSYFIPALLVGFLYLSCKKEGRIDHIVDASTPAPAQVIDVQVKQTAGGAVLTYKIPADPNFFYAKAVYDIQPGVFREAKSSSYTDTLMLVGYGDTEEHEVKIYSVGKNEKASEPVIIKIKPLTPAVKSSFETLTLDATFGGVQISFENSSQANLVIELMVDSTDSNKWTKVKTYYTGAASGLFSARGLTTSSKKYAVFMRDRWNNKSDTLVKVLEPFFEQEIPKNSWAILDLPGDTKLAAEAQFKLEYLFDNKIKLYTGAWASSNSASVPQSFTIDLKKNVVISRILGHQQETSHLYKGSGVKRFELWASNNPNLDGSWDSWTKLGTFDSFKPSGLPDGQSNADDRNYASYNGEEFAFDTLLPAYRYIRWNTLETFSGGGQVIIAEIDLYGQIKP